jgi:two-component system KDP operon response regulator KdpE
MKSDSPLILVVEDDRAIRRVTRAVLFASQYRVIEADTGQKALAEVDAQHPDVMLLDLGLPDMSGLDVIRQLKDSQRLPIVVFSAGGNHPDKIAALDAGAVDYLAKPFLNRELLSRLRSALHGSRGVENESTSHFTFGDLEVDLQNVRVFLGERELSLTSDEFRLMIAFARNCGRLLTYRFLIHEAFESNTVPDQSELQAIVAQLRHKIESDPLRPRYLFAEPGVGYRFQPC